MSQSRLYMPAFYAAMGCVVLGVVMLIVGLPTVVLALGALTIACLVASFVIGVRSANGETPKRDMPIYEVADPNQAIPAYGPLAEKIGATEAATHAAEQAPTPPPLTKKQERTAKKQAKKAPATPSGYGDDLSVEAHPEGTSFDDSLEGSLPNPWDLDAGIGEPDLTAVLTTQSEVPKVDLTAFLTPSPDVPTNQPPNTEEPVIEVISRATPELQEGNAKSEAASSLSTSGWLNDLYTNPDLDPAKALSDSSKPVTDQKSTSGTDDEVVTESKTDVETIAVTPLADVVTSSVTFLDDFVPTATVKDAKAPEESEVTVETSEDISTETTEITEAAEFVPEETPVESDDDVVDVPKSNEGTETAIVVAEVISEDEAAVEVADVVDTPPVGNTEEKEEVSDMSTDDVTEVSNDDEAPRLAEPGTYPFTPKTNEGNTMNAVVKSETTSTGNSLDTVDHGDSYPVLVSDSKVAAIATQIATLVADAENETNRIANERVAIARQESEVELRQAREEAQTALDAARADASREATRAAEKLELSRLAAEDEKAGIISRHQAELATKVDQSELDALAKANKRIADNLEEAESNLSRVVDAQKTVAEAASTSARLQAVSRLRKIRDRMSDEGNEEVTAMVDAFIDEFRI